MSTALTIFDQPNMALPAHVAAFFEEEANVMERNTTPSLNVTGKVWSINLNGESTKLTKPDADGDEVPIQIMRVVILDYGKSRGRSYYEGAYDPNATARPLCWSEDGKTPSAQVREPAAATCAKCQFSVKGSKVSEQGKATTACAQHRILVVVPANDLEFTALRFKIAITSDYDGQSPDLAAKNWYAFSNLIDLMRSKGVQHTAAMVVKMKFDPSAAYPKVIFSPDRWLTAEEAAQIKPRLKSDEVQALVAGQVATDIETALAAPLIPAPKAAAPKAKPAPAPAEEDDEDEAPAPVVKKAPKAKVVVDDDEEEDVAIQTPPKPVAKKAPAKPAPAPVADEDDEEEAPAPKKVAKAAKASPAAPAVKTEVPEDVESLLADWGDD